MNTNDLIKTAQYLDKLGSYKIADKVENKLVRLAAETLLVDSAIKAEIKYIEEMFEKIKNGNQGDNYNTGRFYSQAPYIPFEDIPLIDLQLRRRLRIIKSTEFIRDFNIKRANYILNVIVPRRAQEGKVKEQNTAKGTAEILLKNAKNGISPYVSQPNKKPSEQSGSSGQSVSGKPSGSSKPSGSGKTTGKPTGLGQAIVTVKPTSSTTGLSSSSGGSSNAAGRPPTAPSGTTDSVPPASPQEGKSSLISLLDELDSITANENVWKANVNKVIPKLRKANTLFTEIYDSLSPKEARLLGNRLDMITLANTTFTGRFSGMR